MIHNLFQTEYFSFLCGVSQMFLSLKMFRMNFMPDLCLNLRFDLTCILLKVNFILPKINFVNLFFLYFSSVKRLKFWPIWNNFSQTSRAFLVGHGLTIWSLWLFGNVAFICCHIFCNVVTRLLHLQDIKKIIYTKNIKA